MKTINSDGATRAQTAFLAAKTSSAAPIPADDHAASVLEHPQDKARQLTPLHPQENPNSKPGYAPGTIVPAKTGELLREVAGRQPDVSQPDVSVSAPTSAPASERVPPSANAAAAAPAVPAAATVAEAPALQPQSLVEPVAVDVPPPIGHEVLLEPHDEAPAEPYDEDGEQAGAEADQGTTAPPGPAPARRRM